MIFLERDHMATYNWIHSFALILYTTLTRTNFYVIIEIPRNWQLQVQVEKKS